MEINGWFILFFERFILLILISVHNQYIPILLDWMINFALSLYHYKQGYSIIAFTETRSCTKNINLVKLFVLPLTRLTLQSIFVFFCYILKFFLSIWANAVFPSYYNWSVHWHTFQEEHYKRIKSHNTLK